MFTSKEGRLTRVIERRTVRIPSLFFLGIAGASIAGAAVSYFSGRKELATFIGEWVPTVLLLGLYNKLVKHGA
jgi:hypothetical protein